MSNFICDHCGEEKSGYRAEVKYYGPDEDSLENNPAPVVRTGTWCELCCADGDMCKCDSCHVEFSEDFEMEKANGGWYCMPCYRKLC